MGAVKAKTYRIGCQSWGYDDWITQAGGETVFYPRGTRRDSMLSQYSRIFDTIEVDSTLYGIPAVSTLENWAEATPDGFVFSLKVPREITHERGLSTGSIRVLTEFLETIRKLGPKLGVILIQLPARFEPTTENAANVRSFLGGLPTDFRYAMEFRHPEWLVDRTIDELESAGVALGLVEGKWIDRNVVFDTGGRTTTPHAYVRIMGARDLERFDRVYRDRGSELQLWADKIRQLAAAEVFIYCDNYFEGHAPATANTMKRLLGSPVTEPSILESQGSLF